jgi:membrane protein implicated in regulation of membrane protease activity
MQNSMDNNYFLAVVGVIAIIMEVLLGAPTGFDLLLIGVIFLLGAGVGVLFKSFIFALMAIIFLSFFYVIFGRGVIKNKLFSEDKKTGADRLVGKEAVVVKEITKNKAGQVKVEGEIWRAVIDEVSDDSTIAVGEHVGITSISGVTLTVTL